MSEFKGTKGKWYATKEKDCFVVFCDKPNWDICTTISDLEIDEANALLISKAPEMLEMLSEIVNIFKRGEFDTDENIGGRILIKANELIKQATEL